MIWTVRNKFLLVMSGLLITCLGVYLLMAVTVFKSDKTQLVFDLNRSQAINLVGEIETKLAGVSEKLKLFTLLPGELQDRMAEDLFSENSDVVSVAIFKADQTEPVRAVSASKFLETYGIGEKFFEEQNRVFHQAHFQVIRQKGEALWNATVQNGPPLLGYGRLVLIQDTSGASVDYWVVVGYVKLDHLLKSMSTVRLSDVVVTNSDGEILIHPSSELLAEKWNAAADPVFKDARESKAKVSVAAREIRGEKSLVAFAKGFNGQIIVMAKTSEAEVFRVVRELTDRTLLFGLIVLTLVILAAFLLSNSLTGNIAVLADRMETVSKGDLTTHIHLKGRDETVRLASTFNQMIADLRTSRDSLEQMNRELDQKVKDRTVQLEIQNQKVKEAQEALLRTTRLASVGEIAGRATHELLNPLTILLTRVGLMQKRIAENQSGVLGLIDEIRTAWDQDYRDGGFDKLIQNWSSDSKVSPGHNLFQEDVDNMGKVSTALKDQSDSLAKDVQFVKDEGERIGKIVNAMRRLGHFEADLKPHSLHTVLDDSCQVMMDLFEQKNFSLIKDFGAEKDLCLVDRDELIQALTNLLRNSLQSLGEYPRDAHKSLAVTVRTYNEGNDLIIDIEDTGAGIKREDQAKLFHSGFTTKSRDEGTGLGLGISRRFVRAFDGDIEFVHSKPFESTVFRIRIPLTDQSQHGAVA